MDEDGNITYETLQLKKHFTTNLDLSYTFKMQKFGMKDAMVGITMYNLFSAKFDNNGWAAPQFVQNSNGSVIAVNGNEGCYRDCWAAGFAPSAPFNVMVNLSANF